MVTLSGDKTVCVEKCNFSLADISQLINISGRQRMLSQRIAFLLLSDNENAKAKLSDTINLFKKSHEILENGNLDLPAPKKGTELYEYFFGERQADKKIREYVAHAEGLMRNSRSDYEVFTEIACDEIVPLLNEAVLIYEKMSNTESKKLEQEMEKNTNNLVTTLEEIKEIHKQIRIISINASIVASQAGQYGKAFNVVVGEIKHLGGQIHELIDSGLKSLKK